LKLDFKFMIWCFLKCFPRRVSWIVGKYYKLSSNILWTSQKGFRKIHHIEVIRPIPKPFVHCIN
jgi:hypothetical protein